MNNAQSSGIGLGTVLFLIFLILKLTGTIDWAWWWVTCPLWIPLAIVGGVLAIASISFVFFSLYTKLLKK